MDNQQLLRYSKHLMLPQLDYDGQLAITQSHALIIGAGGLGSPIALYLASSGVGKLTIVDFDHVELSNLQRQIAHYTKDIGRFKVDSAKDKLLALNPEIEVLTIPKALDADELREQVSQCDVVIEASDNFESRFLTNRICLETKTPLISGSAIRFEGQLTTFTFDQPDTPCYHCLFSDIEEDTETCTQSGVFSPAVGVIGSLQACEALKVLAKSGEILSGRLLLFNALNSSWRELKYRKDPECSVCS